MKQWNYVAFGVFARGGAFIVLARPFKKYKWGCKRIRQVL
jgi:hypothetical protein